MKKKKIIHLPWNVGGQAHTLSKFMNNLAWESENLVLSENWIQYETNRYIVGKRDKGFLVMFKRIIALNYLFKYDVVFFNFGTSLFSVFPFNKSSSKLRNIKQLISIKFNSALQIFELKILQYRKVTILIQYQGDDARQGDWAQENQEISIAKEVSLEYYNKNSDELKRKQIKLFDKFCDKIYALNPDLLNVLPQRATFLPYCHIDLNEWKPNIDKRKSKVLRIGHAPTSRVGKGTKYLLDAISELEKKNYKFEFVLIENIEHSAVKQMYETIDVFVDQLLAGWYGGVAVEMMALGKPVVAYIREEDLGFIPLKMREELPIVQATPNSITNVLEKLFNTPNIELFELGIRGRKYVEKWHNPQIVSDQILRDIEQIMFSK